MKNVVVLISGNGTNLQAIIDSKLVNIVGVISDKSDAYGLVRASNVGISTNVLNSSEFSNREEYDLKLADVVNSYYPDLVVLAGFMRILGKGFLDRVSNVINLHPALPGQFDGADGIGDAFRAFKEGKITYTGVMCHEVVLKVDSGKVLSKLEVPIYKNDTLESLTTRVKSYEKTVLLNGIEKKLCELEDSNQYEVYCGKVRNCYNVGYDLMVMEHSDRQSAFDRNICEIKYKGQILTEVASWWFNQTKHIVPNHYLYHHGRHMVVRKCKPFKVEVIVRGYITGNTKTSLWTHYKNGSRNYCGNILPEGLVEHQKLDRPILTPTTKGDIDEPIGAEEIVNRGLMTHEQWDYISRVAFELYNYGSMVSKQHGLLLVDTKYEFGVYNNKIMLIDELHTCDSSRFWLANSDPTNPTKLDKDIVRDWLRKQCNPYTDELPEIPQELLDTAFKSYNLFAKMLMDNEIMYTDVSMEKVLNTYFMVYEPTVVVYCGSTSDNKFVDGIVNLLNEKGIYTERHVLSAHKQPSDLLKQIEYYNKFKKQIVNICVAGMTNALGAVTCYASKHFTINCPPFKDTLDMMTNLNSNLVNPSQIDVVTILNYKNCVKAVCKLINK